MTTGMQILESAFARLNATIRKAAHADIPTLRHATYCWGSCLTPALRCWPRTFAPPGCGLFCRGVFGHKGGPLALSRAARWGNRIQGANCSSAASSCPAGSAPRRMGQSQRQSCPFFSGVAQPHGGFFSLDKQIKESPSRRETEAGNCNQTVENNVLPNPNYPWGNTNTLILFMFMPKPNLRAGNLPWSPSCLGWRYTGCTVALIGALSA